MDSTDASQISCSSSSAYSQLSSQQESAYIPISRLGKGAFGEAWLYRKTEDNDEHLVVWKMVNLLGLDERRRREAQNEIDVLHMLDHPNIVAYYNHFLDGSMLLIEMEYANGGSLYQFLGQCDSLLDERTVVWFTFQLTNGIRHIHELGILHRDIKTLNIFLTKSRLIKVGDFGIAKVLGSEEMAETCQGTPYYMSPELVQGRRYNYKSDIWALGCVLFEMLTLKRAFDATNQLKLAQNIVQTELNVALINAQYTQQMRQLVSAMMSKNPDDRPSAKEVLDNELFVDKDKLNARVRELQQISTISRPSSAGTETIPVVTSKTNEVFYWGGGRHMPSKIEQFERENSALQVAVGNYHMAVVTIEREVFTWCNLQGTARLSGQLGHGDLASYRTPKKVTSLVGVPIEEARCGEDFTILRSTDGQLYSCGSNYYGCLGIADQDAEEKPEELLEPQPIPFFISQLLVKKVSCGDQHVLAVTKQSEVYSWGCGEYGRLGLDSEDDFSTPQLAQLPINNQCITNAFCGSETSFLLTEGGRVLACGSNENNKLGFYSVAKGLTAADSQFTYDTPCVHSFKVVKPLTKYQIQHISSGTTHTAAIDNCNQLLMFGSNRYGQLGVGDHKRRNGIHNVGRYCGGKRFHRVACGDGFTVACTTDNHVYSWGRSDSGRLGVDLPNTGHSVPTPRPIFGALHLVADAASKHWHTLIIAERVLEQRTVRPSSSRSQSASRLNSTVDEVASISDEASSAGPESPLPGTDTCPSWLKAELQDAEVIPLDNAADEEQQDQGQQQQQQQQLSDSTPQQTPRCNCQCSQLLEERDEEIRKLKLRISELELQVKLQLEATRQKS